MVWARRVVQVHNDAGSPFIEGPDTITYSYNLNLVTGNGALWGTDRLEPVAYPGGAFDCSWHGIFDSFVWTGRGVCQGEGTLDGQAVHVGCQAPGHALAPDRHPRATCD